MRLPNTFPSFKFLAVALSVIVIVLACVCASKFIPSLSAQSFAASKSNDIAGLSIASFQDPGFEGLLDSFLGEKASLFPASLKKVGLLVTNNSQHRIVGFTIRTSYRPTPESPIKQHDMYLHANVTIPSYPVYRIKPGESVWITPTFAFNSSSLELPPHVIAVLDDHPVYNPSAVGHSIYIDSILVMNSTKGQPRRIRILGPDRMNSLQKIQQEKMADIEALNLALSAAENTNGQGASLVSLVKSAKNSINPNTSLNLSTNPNWFLLRKKILLNRLEKIATNLPTPRVAEMLQEGINSSAEVSK